MEFPIKQIACNQFKHHTEQHITNPFIIIQSVHNFLHSPKPSDLYGVEVMKESLSHIKGSWAKEDYIVKVQGLGMLRFPYLTALALLYLLIPWMHSVEICACHLC